MAVSQALLAARIFDGQRLRRNQMLVIEHGKVKAIRPAVDGERADLVFGPDEILMPGLVDLQVNGGGGILLNDAPTAATIWKIAHVHRARGTLSLLPTLITDGPEAVASLEAEIGEIARIPGVIGLHLEGPHLNPARKGIHPAHHMRPIEEADIQRILRLRRHLPILVTLAPELVPVEAIRQLVQSGVRVAAGHSESRFEEMAEAAGLSGATHLFNAMSQIGPRAPGLVGRTLVSDSLMAGIISDGIHVADANVRLAYRAMGAERLFIVSDAMATIGSDSDSFKVGNRTITLRDGRLTGEDGTLAGAHTDLAGSVAQAVHQVGIPLAHALRMATSTPARFMGLEGQVGRFVRGANADWITLDRKLALKRSSLG
jgi:N-acetylglucosamine-6-phosphate deacetylase